MRNRILILFIFLSLIIVSNYTTYASTTVAVVDFTNHTGYHLKGIEKVASELLATMLTNNKGFQVVEREKLESIITEHDFTESGLVDQGKNAIQLGKLLGAEYIITGSLINLDIEEKTFEGYGIKTEKVVLTLSCNIKTISVTTGLIEAGNFYTASESYQGYTSHSITVDLTSKARTLLSQIMSQFVTDLDSLSNKPEEESRELLVEFKSNPTGASIEIDGIYMGSTPVKISITEGIHSVCITLGGYEPWDKKIKVYEGLVVNVTLGEKIKDEGDE